MKPYNLRILLGASLFFFLFQTSHAEEDIRYYDVELVIFESLQDDTESNEMWPPSRHLDVPENAAVLGRKYEGKLPPEYNPQLLFNSLAVEDYQLTEEIENLKTSEQYRILLHTGWRQPGLAKKDAVTVYINHAIAEYEEVGEPSTAFEETTSEQINPPTALTPDAPAPATEAAPAMPMTLPEPLKAVASLQGMVTIVLSRYLHLEAELIYTKEPNTESVDMFDTAFLEDRRGKETIYYMKQNRRMRSKETHYIDHPKFSMLIHITPYEGMAARAPVSKPPTIQTKPR